MADTASPNCKAWVRPGKYSVVVYLFDGTPERHKQVIRALNDEVPGLRNIRQIRPDQDDHNVAADESLFVNVTSLSPEGRRRSDKDAEWIKLESVYLVLVQLLGSENVRLIEE